MLEVLFGSRSLENPSTDLANPAEWLMDALGGAQSTSGIRVSRKAALTCSAVWRAVWMISTAVGKVPLYVYRRTAGGKDRDTAHPAYRLLAREASPHRHAFTLKQLLTHHALLLGNGYAWIERDGAARPLSLTPLDPTRTAAVVIEGNVWYRHTTATGQTAAIRAEDVLHVRGMGWDGLTGYSVVEYGANSLGLGLGAAEYAGRFFSNGATPPAVLEHPGRLTDDAMARLRKSWEASHGGLSNAHKVAILEEGMKVHSVGISARDAQLIELRQFEIREVANWFQLPPHKLGDTSRTAYNSLEQENQSYLDDALDGWFVTWEAECWSKLLTEEEKRRDSHVVEFLREALMRVDLKARGEYYRLATAGAPWMLIDEIRQKENLAPLGDERTGALQFPANNFGAAEPSGDDGAAGAARADLEGQVERMRRRLTADRARANNGTEWLRTLDERHGHILDAALGPPARVLERLTGDTGILERTKQALLEELTT